MLSICQYTIALRCIDQDRGEKLSIGSKTIVWNPICNPVIALKGLKIWLGRIRYIAFMAVTILGTYCKKCFPVMQSHI